MSRAVRTSAAVRLAEVEVEAAVMAVKFDAQEGGLLAGKQEICHVVLGTIAPEEPNVRG